MAARNMETETKSTRVNEVQRILIFNPKSACDAPTQRRAKELVAFLGTSQLTLKNRGLHGSAELILPQMANGTKAKAKAEACMGQAKKKSSWASSEVQGA